MVDFPGAGEPRQQDRTPGGGGDRGLPDVDAVGDELLCDVADGSRIARRGHHHGAAPCVLDPGDGDGQGGGVAAIQHDHRASTIPSGVFRFRYGPGDQHSPPNAGESGGCAQLGAVAVSERSARRHRAGDQRLARQIRRCSRADLRDSGRVRRNDIDVVGAELCDIRALGIVQHDRIALRDLDVAQAQPSAAVVRAGQRELDIAQLRGRQGCMHISHSPILPALAPCTTFVLVLRAAADLSAVMRRAVSRAKLSRWCATARTANVSPPTSAFRIFDSESAPERDSRTSPFE